MAQPQSCLAAPTTMTMTTSHTTHHSQLHQQQPNVAPPGVPKGHQCPPPALYITTNPTTASQQAKTQSADRVFIPAEVVGKEREDKEKGRRGEEERRRRGGRKRGRKGTRRRAKPSKPTPPSPLTENHPQDPPVQPRHQWQRQQQ